MLINTTMALALFCVSCGKLHMEDISCFSLGSSGAKVLHCRSGHYLGIVRAYRAALYEVYVPCELCGELHMIKLGCRFSEKAVRRLYACQQTEIGLAGSRDAVERELTARDSEIASYLAGIFAEGDVNDPQAMFEVVNHLEELADTGNINCCSGSGIGLEVQEKYAIVYCRCCGNAYRVRAVNEEDVKKVQGMKFIQLAGAGKKQSQ